MSLDHFFTSKNTDEEVAYFSHNYFVEYSFQRIIDHEWYEEKEVIKSDLEMIVAEYGDCISKLGEGNVIPADKELYDMEDGILNIERSALFFAELVSHFKPAVVDYLEHESTVGYAVERMFYKFVQAYVELRKLLETFDFENDKLTIEQCG